MPSTSSSVMRGMSRVDGGPTGPRPSSSIYGDAARNAAQVLRDGGATAIAAAVDVADRASVEKAMDQARNELGPIKILVTCAAIARWEAFGDMPFDSWSRVLAVNLNGTFH